MLLEEIPEVQGKIVILSVKVYEVSVLQQHHESS
jgi:hypothetical protein